jgi:hypothetical protein
MKLFTRPETSVVAGMVIGITDENVEAHTRE